MSVVIEGVYKQSGQVDVYLSFKADQKRRDALQ